MRKTARIAGMLWMAMIAMAGIVLLASGRFTSNRLLMYALVGAALPGAFCVRWGRAQFPNPGRAQDLLAEKAPFDRAAEAGHVMKIESGPRA